MRMLLSAAALSLTTTVAIADVDVSFIEGAPKDRFEIVNTSKCEISNAELVIDLNGSVGGLIFDVSATGAGVEVFQPFEVVAGNAFLTAKPQVRDGDQRIALSIGKLPAGEKIGFTIDVDDTANTREITVDDSELSGASASLRLSGQTLGQTFSAIPQLTISGLSCT